MRDISEIEEILDALSQKINLANRKGELDELLIALGMNEFLEKENLYDTHRDGKIVVIGNSAVKENDLLGIIKGLGLEKERFEFCLDYKKAKTYNYRKLQYNPYYRLVIMGAVPHSSTGKGHSGSVVEEMQRVQGYPKVVPLYNGQELKITKTNFSTILKKYLDEYYI